MLIHHTHALCAICSYTICSCTIGSYTIRMHYALYAHTLYAHALYAHTPYSCTTPSSTLAAFVNAVVAIILRRYTHRTTYTLCTILIRHAPYSHTHYPSLSSVIILRHYPPSLSCAGSAAPRSTPTSQRVRSHSSDAWLYSVS
jgi:hypothetical protein